MTKLMILLRILRFLDPQFSCGIGIKNAQTPRQDDPKLKSRISRV